VFAALDHQEYQAIRTIGHQLSGTGTSYGFPVLTEIGAALEQAAIAKDSAAIRTQTERLQACLGQIRY